MKVSVDLKTVDATNYTETATAHLTKNYHQLRSALGNAQKRFDFEVNKFVEY